MAKIKSTLFPGDEWIYFKIYTGIKTADTILVTTIRPLVKKLKKEKLIKGWFFIRYTDPDFHIRLRFLIESPAVIGEIIQACHKHFNKLCREELIRKIDISTYMREIQRYGEKHMEISEEIFSADSDCILSLLDHLKRKDENYRWMVALKLVDNIFGDLGYDLTARSSYIERMSEGFKREFGYNMYNAKQLNAIYRDRRKTIASSLATITEDTELLKADQIIRERTKVVSNKIKGVKLPDENTSSYIHMCMNRLFRSQNRVHELLIYDFLSRHYKSEIARLTHKK